MEVHINTFGTSLRIIDGMLSIKWEKDFKQVQKKDYIMTSMK